MILTYHEIEPEFAARSYAVLLKTLHTQLSAIADLNRTEPRLTPAITFDDGHESHHRYAAPALKAANLRATFFITAGWIGKRPGYMSPSDLRDLAGEGHCIGSHGWSHAMLTHCDRLSLCNELLRSRVFLENCLGAPVAAISMPGGRWNNRVLAACAEAGYDRVFHSDPFQKPRKKCGVELLGRIMVRRNMDAAGLVALLRAGNAKRMALRIRHGAKCIVRSLAGDAIYQRIWELVGTRAGSR